MPSDRDDDATIYQDYVVLTYEDAPANDDKDDQ